MGGQLRDGGVQTAVLWRGGGLVQQHEAIVPAHLPATWRVRAGDPVGTAPRQTALTLLGSGFVPRLDVLPLDFGILHLAVVGHVPLQTVLALLSHTATRVRGGDVFCTHGDIHEQHP